MVGTSWASAAGFLLLLSFGVNASALILGFVHLLRNWHASSRRALWTVVLGAAAVLFAFVAVGAALGFAKAFGALGGESVDPSEKARMLAEGISEVMNCMALGVLAMPLSAGYLIYAAVSARRMRRGMRG